MKLNLHIVFHFDLNVGISWIESMGCILFLFTVLSSRDPFVYFYRAKGKRQHHTTS